MAGSTKLSNHFVTGPVMRLVYTFTADAADGSIPSIALPKMGGTLVALQTNPGATAPTDDWDLTLIDDDGLDRFGGRANDRDTANSERVPLGVLVDNAETLTLTFANNSVNSAVGQVVIFYSLAAAPSYPLGGIVPNTSGARPTSVLAAGDHVDQWFSSSGAVVIAGGAVTMGDASNNVACVPDGTGGAGYPWQMFPMLFNGTTWDRQRSNEEATVLASAARTASPANADITNYNGEAVDIIIDCSLYPAAASVVFTVKGKDALSGNYYTILTSAAITGVGTTVLSIGRGLTAAANTVANAILPRTFQVQPVHADADSITYSIAANIGD